MYASQDSLKFFVEDIKEKLYLDAGGFQRQLCCNTQRYLAKMIVYLSSWNKLFAYPFFFFWFVDNAIDDLNVSAAVELFLVTLAHSAHLGLVVAAPRVSSVVAPLDDTVIASQAFWKSGHSF